MYRKYSGSTKSSRNERLAQLSEQESVIEKKKREILAKIEAQKKKETEEALKKLEPTTYKKDYLPTPKTNSCDRERNPEEEMKNQVPRNAFSNDGSFLDQFKKLSQTGLGPKNISTLANLAKKEELSDGVIPNVEREEKEKQSGNNQSRKEHDDHVKCRKGFNSHQSFNRKLQDSNFQIQLPPPGVAQIVTQEVPGTTQKLTTAGENVTENNSSLLVSASNSQSQIPVSFIQPQSEMFSQNAQSPMFIQGETPTKDFHLCGAVENKEQSERNNTRNNNESFDNAEYFIESKRKEEHPRKKCLDPVSDETRSQYISTVSLSKTNSTLGTDEATRISPALTDNEEDSGEASENCHSSKTIRPRVEAKGGLSPTAFVDELKTSEESNEYVTPGNSLNRKDMRNIASASQINTSNWNINFEDKSYEKQGKKRNSDYDSSDSDSNSKDSFHLSSKISRNRYQVEKNTKSVGGDGYQADCEDGSNYGEISDQRQKKVSLHKTSIEDLGTGKEIVDESKDNENSESGDVLTAGERRKRRKKSRWGEEVVPATISNAGSNLGVQPPKSFLPIITGAAAGKTPMLSKLTRSDPGLIQYAKQTFGSTNLSEEDWKKAEDHYKINLLYQDMVKKRAEIDRLEKAGKFKYEYDSDEDVEGGTWEHKLRQQEMLATQLWAEELTRQAAGKHHIGDFLPPEELERFMERYNAVKQGRKPDLSDYKEFKLKEDNVGYRLLQKMGWNEGQGLGQDGSGITNPVNKASTRHENQGLGVERPDGLEAGDDEYDAYRKRMMLAYRFRPNPLNNPRRPYY